MMPSLFVSFIHSYGVMLAVGFYAAWWLAARRAKAEGIDPDVIGNVVLIAIVAGVVGARLVWFAFYRNPAEPWWMIVQVWEGGLVFYGGLIGAVAALAAYFRWRGLDTWRLADVVAPSVAIGQAFGRIGCFLNGCCYGGVASAGFPLAMRFPAFHGADGRPIGSPVFLDHVSRGWVADSAAASLPVHPAQLYASASLFLITLLIVVATPYKRRHGELFALVCILNALSRLGMEFVRSDVGAVALGLTTGQIGAVIVLALGLGLFVWLRLRGKRVEWESDGQSA